MGMAVWPRRSSSSADIKYLVVSFTSDWLYPTYHSKEMVSALTAVGADVTYCNLQSTWGHDAFLLEVETMTRSFPTFWTASWRRHGIGLPEAAAPVSLTVNASRLDCGHSAIMNEPYRDSSRPARRPARDRRPVRPGEKVLDLGCGDGRLLRYLS